MKRDELAKAVALLRRGDWEAAHRIVQQDEESPLACWAHGIVHLMEGDTSNARYWYREAKREFPRDPSVADEIAALSALVLRSRGTQE
jgi:Flp pilus assembly protein TadD